MYYIAVCVCFAVCVFSAPAPTDVAPLEKQQPTVIPIISQSDELEPNGTYHFSYETGNGIKREEISYDKVVPKAQSRSADSNEGGQDSDGDSDEIHVQMGSYSYTAPDGTLISVRYIADENGFQPIGDHIPRVPSAAAGSNSGEKSGRALNAADNFEAQSAPAPDSKPADKPAAVPQAATAPDSKSAETSEVTSTSAPSDAESSTRGADSSTTVASESAATTSSPEKASTTDAAKSSESSSEVSTDGSTPASDVATPAPDSSTIAVDASTSTADASTPPADSSTPAANI